MHSRKNRQIFECGYIIADRYQIVKLIGQGGYGDIYSVEEITDKTLIDNSNSQNRNNSSSNKLYAMKIESLTAEKKGLDLEIEILSQLQDSPFFPHIHERGMTQTHRFLVMDLFGPSISNTRRQMSSHKFSLGTVLQIGIFMIECIRSFHQHGFVHRDIKPGNFLLRCLHYSTEVNETNNNMGDKNEIYPNSKTDSEQKSVDNINSNENIYSFSTEKSNMINPLALIDFGLSKRYIDPETSLPYPEKNRAGFRGTCKYASIYAHNFHDQCPRDDLISWCYSMVELVEGYLPWGNLRENSRVRQIKSQFLPKNLFRSLPREFLEIWRYLNSLKYDIAMPKYDYIIQLVSEPFYNYIFNKSNKISTLNSSSNLNVNSNSNLTTESNEVIDENKRFIPFDWEILSREQIESYSGVSSLPAARDVPLPPRIGGGLITDNDDTQNFGKGSKCVGCFIF